jgi:hypothetical protein
MPGAWLADLKDIQSRYFVTNAGVSSRARFHQSLGNDVIKRTPVGFELAPP